MKFNFKKIASVLATTVMLGSTVAFAAAAYPEPFVMSGAGDAAIVVGSGDGVSATDTVAATDLGASLDAKITSSATSSLTGTGDKAGIDSSARKIYYGNGLNAAKSALSASEMPTVLADGKVISLTGTEYAYTQSIVLGDTAVTYGTSGGDLSDPTLYIDAGTTATDPIYNYTLTFNKNINVTDSTNIQGQKIKILGVDYVIGASSTGTALYLYGAGETVKLTGGETKTVTIASKEHIIELTSTSSTTSAKLVVDGVAKTVTKGSSYSYAGDLNVYVKDITHPAFAGDVRDAELIIGANTLLLQNGQTVKIGADQTSVQGTNAVIASTSGDFITSVKVQIALKKSQSDHIAIGSSIKDPVFGGLKVQLVSANPTLTDSTRSKIKVDTDNNQYAYVTFTSARAGEKGEQRLTYVYDNNTVSTAVQPLLAHQTITTNNRGNIHVLEGASARLNDWIVINQGDNGVILNVDDISFDTTTSGTVTFSDAITGESQKVTLTAAVAAGDQFTKSSVNFFGGNGYYIAATNATADPNKVNVTWSSAGTQTVFPRIKLKDGGWIALLTSTTVNNGTDIIFPDGRTSLASSGNTVFGNNRTQTVAANGITWGIQNATQDVNPIVQNITGGPNCNFNKTVGPAILYIEPKKWNDGSQGNFTCVPMTTTGTTEIAIGTPLFSSANSGFQTWNSDTYKSTAVDEYGAYVINEQRTNENGVTTIYTPASQMYFDIQFTSEAVSATTKDSIKVVKDTEVDSVKGKNLIVIGGSCINQAAAMILTGKTDAVCGDAFAALTNAGAGKYLIQVAKSPYNDAKIAMLVAGYDAADTTTAVAKVKEGKELTTVGSKTVYPLATA